MKQLFFLLAFSFLIFSCENESTDSIDDNTPETPALVLKEMLALNETFGGQDLSYFNTLGQPTSNDVTLSNGNEYTREKFFYNENNHRDSVFIQMGFEARYVVYNYEGNQLTNIVSTSPSTQNANINWDLSYDGNEMYVMRDYIFENETVTSIQKFVFSDETHEKLLYSEFVNTDALPSLKYEYMYDSNSNLIQRTELELNNNTQSLEVVSTIEYSYDGKKNPFKSLPGTNYLVMSNAYLSNTPIFTLNYQSTNNVTSKTRTTDNNVKSWTYEYEYNELDFPINIIDTEYNSTQVGDEPVIYRIYNKTLTYYNN
ncbi:hypothetical protein [Psychroserpens algicola]|uniref:YD repeat-containing protein n=1 Tax=Psychroserpens algicola TaxID=1719034 RepID=A0ABT0HAV8_9FLAO|nr:hypothetical protein [Psychroserpens algicola]MCK8481317.1 hypothetical protein [Psychroserpens algicola]